MSRAFKAIPSGSIRLNLFLELPDRIESESQAQLASLSSEYVFMFLSENYSTQFFRRKKSAVVLFSLNSRNVVASEPPP